MYVAINVPVTRLLSTPLTLPMLRAARGPLGDSIAYYFTPVNLGAIILVLASGAGFPLLLSRAKLRFATPMVIAGVAIVSFGPVAVSKVETVGLHRNAFGALIPARLPVYSGMDRSSDWRTSPFPSATTPEILPNTAVPRPAGTWCSCCWNPRHPGICVCTEPPKIPRRI